jgi:hypothetical protein
MQKRFFLFHSSAILSFLMISCVFSPDEEYHKNIDQNIAPPRIMDLSNFSDEDTIFLWGSTWFNFNYTSSKQQVFAVKVYVNDTVFTYEGASGTFYLRPDLFDCTCYTPLKLELYTGSGTGSLADHFHYEGFKFEKNYVLAIGMVRQYDQNLRSYINQDGFLTLKWERYPWENFLAYSFNYPDYVINKYFQDREITSFVDSNFVGGNQDYLYRYQLQSENGAFYQSPDNTFKVSRSLPHISFLNNAGNFIVRWSKPEIRCLCQLNDSRDMYTFYHPVHDEDTSIIIPFPGVGFDYSVNLFLLPLNKPQGYPYIDGKMVSAKWSMDAVSIKPFNFLQYHQATNRFYLTCDNLLVIMSADLKTLASKSLFHTGNNAFEFIDQTKQIAIIKDKLSFYDIETLQLDKDYQVSLVQGSNFVSVANDSIVIYNDGAELVSYNYQTSQVRQRLRFSSSIYYNKNLFSASRNLRWMVYASYDHFCVMKNVGDYYYQKIIDSDGSCLGAIFDPAFDNLLWVGKSDRLLLYNLESGSILEDYPQVHGILMNIDPYTNNLLVRSNTEHEIYLFNLSERKLILKMPYLTQWENSFDLINNKLYENCGYQYDLNPYLP